MPIQVSVPAAADLHQVAVDLSAWQTERGTLELHPGDLGWHSMVGAARAAADLRVWSRDDTMVALGLLDGPALLRVAVDPEAHDDDELVRQIGSDVDSADAGVLAVGEAVVAARGAPSLRRFLSGQGWAADEPWTPFHYDLSRPVSGDRGERTELRFEIAGPDQAEAWVAVHWSAFKGTPFGDADKRRLMERWRAMADGPFSHRARHLIGFDRHGEAAAVTSAWSAGTGRPGLIEPMGVHGDHRGRGYGVDATLAGAAALKDMGSSSAVVATANSNARALATYAAAGFTAGDPVADLRRSA